MSCLTFEKASFTGSMIFHGWMVYIDCYDLVLVFLVSVVCLVGQAPALSSFEHEARGVLFDADD